MQSKGLSVRRSKIATVVAVLAAGFGAATWQDAAADSKSRDFSHAAGVIVGSSEQLALSVTNPGKDPIHGILKVTGASGETFVVEEMTLEAGATVMPDVISGEQLAGEDSTEWPIYGQPISVALTSAGGELKPILSVTTLGLDGQGARAWPIYGRADLQPLA